MNRSGALVVFCFAAVCAIALFTRYCGAPAVKAAVAARTAVVPPRAGKVEVLFASSESKREWVDAVVSSFNARKVQVGGRPVVVTASHMRTGDSRQRILDGTEKPTLWSPPSQAWVRLINRDWQLREGKSLLADDTRDTARTALVIAIWEPMARALGWPDKPLGWADLRAIAEDPRGWGAVGQPQWHRFKFGHAHPDHSNSAMLSVISLLYAAAGKTSGLTLDDMRSPRVIGALKAIEESVVHYGETSSWLTEKLCTRGPAYLSAVTLYESSVVKANLKWPNKPSRLVAIYPKEGTFWETHPTGVVQADWVTSEQREAANLFLDFLTSPEQQARTSQFGFRPAQQGVAPAPPFDKEHGVDPAAAQKPLAYLEDDLFLRANSLWHQTKKKAAVWMLIDTSGSMNGEPLLAARRGAVGFLKRMEPDDLIKVVAFGAKPVELGAGGKVRDVGESLVHQVEGLHAEGSTSLHDALLAALAEAEETRKRDPQPRSYGIVVLSDGKDTASKATRPDVLSRLPPLEDPDGTRVFTIAYGGEADADYLRELAVRSNAVTVKGGSADVEKLYEQLSSYF